MFMEGNMSTGILLVLETPTTRMKRLTTRMKYGLRIAKRDTV